VGFIEDALFDDDVKDLKISIKEMVSLVESALQDAFEALKNRDKEGARRVLDGDDEIDLKEVQIEEKALELIALRHPVKENLRFIFTVVKIITDLERIGDQACNIAHVVLMIADEPLLKPLIDLPRMLEISTGMLRDGIKALFEGDEELARDVFNRDKELDELYDQIFNELLLFMIQDPHTIKRATGLLFVARHFERVGDHATNIAERAYYMITGRRIKEKFNL